MGKDRAPPRRPSCGGCPGGLAVQQLGAVGEVTDEPGWVVRLSFDLQTDGVTEVERAVETLVDVVGELPRLGPRHLHVPAPSPTAPQQGNAPTCTGRRQCPARQGPFPGRGLALRACPVSGSDPGAMSGGGWLTPPVRRPGRDKGWWPSRGVIVAGCSEVALEPADDDLEALRGVPGSQAWAAGATSRETDQAESASANGDSTTICSTGSHGPQHQQRVVPSPWASPATDPVGCR